MAGAVLEGKFAAAVKPIADSTVIVTDSEGLEAGMISIAAGDGAALPAYRAVPRDGAWHATVLVIQEIFGLHEHIQDVVRRLAKRGYLAIAPELYFRQGDPSQIDGIDELRARIVSRVPDAQVLADLDATLQWADRHGGDAHRVGVTGFCWGGRATWLYVAHQPRVRAAVAWYGKLAGPTGPLTPRQPLDVAGELKAPVLGLYGGEDASIPLADVEAMRGKLKEAGGHSLIHVYPEAPHAFYADYRPSYRRAAALDGWERMLGWLQRHGV
ncbi:MAG TPA: dienelactone hydrolase family protein [Burkholderiaceae bacterium]|nr:dienelactone hydrolase family protein [Burkholderiaceae bacterium]